MTPKDWLGQRTAGGKAKPTTCRGENKMQVGQNIK